jgi:crotonobetainyl-CoA:carnitine CoA-transferase CaiB-like acyl-CoA transferase
MLLGDLGAEVIKIEAPGEGDDTRSWQPPSWSGHSATFLAANRNKRSIAVDLNSLAGQQIVRQLAGSADVLVTSFRPSSLEKRNLDHEALQLINPGIVYCEISAYGSRSPKRNMPGYDPVLQAESGIMDLTGYSDGPPARLGIGAIDLGTAMWAAIGIQAALMKRAQSGHGSLIEVSLYETAGWWLSYYIAGLLASGDVPTRQGSAISFIAPYEAFMTAHGDLMVTAANDQMFLKLCEQLGMPELPKDLRFRHNADRVEHREELRALLQSQFLTKDAVTWESMLREASIPCSRVRSVAEFVKDDLTEILGMIEPVPHPDIPDLRLVGMPLSLDGARGERQFPPPRLGEHTREILSELGLSAEKVEELERMRVVSCLKDGLEGRFDK